jgi:hypothetical protein
MVLEGMWLLRQAVMGWLVGGAALGLHSMSCLTGLGIEYSASVDAADDWDLDIHLGTSDTLPASMVVLMPLMESA